MSNFIFFNPNPNQKYHKNGKPCKWNGVDCTVRALSKIEKLSWQQSFDMLVDKARGSYKMPDDIDVIKIVLKDLDYKYFTFTPGSRITVNEFIKNHPKGQYIVHIQGHVSAIDDGKIYDTWDCGNYTVCSYWIK